MANSKNEMKELIFSTNNAHKLGEVQALLKGKFALKTLRECGITEDIPETAETLEGNALLKARYAGDEHDFDANNALLLKNLEGESNRKARFRTVIALILGDKEYLFEGIVEGTIIDHMSGTEGFGYDPMFVPEGETRTFAEMSAEEKNAISHRGRAVAKLVEFLQTEN